MYNVQRRLNRRRYALLATACWVCLIGCAGLSRHPTAAAPRKAFVAQSGAATFASYAPVFVVQTHERAYNRIGSPAARTDRKGREHISIDPSHATFYAQKVEFQAASGRYTNLVYRVHFQRVPWGDITMGPNVGLLVIITLDAGGRPVLVTSAHTCGCYKAMIPTSYLSAAAWPEKWNPVVQEVYGESLPGLLSYPAEFSADYRPVVYVRDDTHRIMDVRIENVKEAVWRYDVIAAEIAAMDTLHALPIDGRTTPFFETRGRRKGFVKGSRKPLEKLFIGWWALDLNVGCDKDYGPSEETGTIFYTSLKIWKRRQSDMWNFPQFLACWGWRL